MSNYKRSQRSNFNQGFSFERFLSAPFRWIGGIFQSRSDSGRLGQETPVHLIVLRVLGVVVLLPFIILIYLGWFAVAKWAISRQGMSFLFGVPALMVASMFSGGLIWLSSINSSVKLGGYYKRAEQAGVREEWDRMVHLAQRCVVSEPSYEYKYNLYEKLLLREQMGSEVIIEKSNLPYGQAVSENASERDRQRAEVLLNQIAPDEGTGYWIGHYKKAAKKWSEMRKDRQGSEPYNPENLETVKEHLKKMLEVGEAQTQGVASAEAGLYRFHQVEAYQILADIYREEGDWKAARTQYLRLFSIDARFASNLVKAERKLAELAPDEQTRMMETRAADTHFALAVELLTKKLGNDQGRFAYYQALANLYINEEKYEDANRILVSGLERCTDPSKRVVFQSLLGDLHFEWYMVHMDQDEQNQAIAQLTEQEFLARYRRLVDAITNRPLSTRYYMSVWTDGWMDFDFGSAQMDWINRESLVNENGYVIECLVAAKYLMDGQTNMARQKLRIAEKQRSQMVPVVICKLANALAAKRPGSIKEASELFKVMSDVTPNDYFVLRLYADLLFTQKKYEQAIQYYEISLEDRLDLDGLIILAICYQKIGNEVGAKIYRDAANEFSMRTSREPVNFEDALRQLELNDTPEFTEVKETQD
jgi:tetratricopeptide (TPR) repeat protein